VHLADTKFDQANPTGGTDFLLIGVDQIGFDLGPRFAAAPMVQLGDKSDVRQALAKHDSPAVVFAAPRNKLDVIAREIHQLRAGARITIFPPSGDSPTNTADAPDEYPPSRGELSLLLRGVHRGPTAGDRPLTISAEVINTLVAGTDSVETLEKRVAELLGEVLEEELRWVPAGQCPQDAQPILMLPGTPARLLVQNAATKPDEPAQAIIDDLHLCLPTILAVARRTEALNRLAITDHLTNAYNRRYFYHLTDRVLARAKREGFRASLLLYDIDDFKRYNDEFGHAAGDEILRETAALIKRITREQDIVARIGGDEFAVLFWDSKPRDPDSKPLQDAWGLADRFRKGVERMEFASLGPEAAGSLTISGGMATFPAHGLGCQELLRRADEAMMKAKASGKNSIHLIGQDETG